MTAQLPQREIKFRAWDKKEKRMIEVCMIYFVHKDQGEIKKGTRIIEKEDSQFLQAGKDVILMEFTGLHDRNGKEIWEGDIVKTSRGIAEIIYKPGKFLWKIGAHGTYIPDAFDADRETEVIGNIFQHPELMEGK